MAEQPEMRTYMVREVRAVEVMAEGVEGATALARAAFEHGQMETEPAIAAGKSPEGVWGNTTTRIRVLATRTYEIGSAADPYA